ncbi:hypothetical protein T459_30312 [Capsicum annuum]|uniref:Endonuclease/exonuclease/phosphatase domain-containing protein n=1 Tax=Capsicum annuum TaxID=4072 RepID=A0A2G2Y811_CAPAN|nr:hypothetical protein T459_30312 [Capsicum annuum]
MYRPKNQNGKNEGQKDKKMVYKWIGKAIEENKKINNPIQIEKKSVTQINTTIMTTGKENGTTTLKLVEGGATVSNPYTEMGNRKNDFTCAMTVVYESNNMEERKELWKGLGQIRANIIIPWCICGDFNLPLTSEDRIGGQLIHDYETRDFQEMMDRLNLVDMKAMGRYFTWTNKHIWSKIDRDVCNNRWIMQYGGVTAQFLKNYFSDSPIQIEIMPESPANRGPFRFINTLNEDERFLKIVQQIWNTSLAGTSMYKLWRKLGDVVSALKLKEKFDMFSGASGLKTNMVKSQVYFGGVKTNIQNDILLALGYEKGELLFKYLGVPLSSKRLTA